MACSGYSASYDPVQLLKGINTAQKIKFGMNQKNFRIHLSILLMDENYETPPMKIQQSVWRRKGLEEEKSSAKPSSLRFLDIDSDEAIVIKVRFIQDSPKPRRYVPKDPPIIFEAHFLLCHCFIDLNHQTTTAEVQHLTSYLIAITIPLLLRYPRGEHFAFASRYPFPY